MFRCLEATVDKKIFICCCKYVNKLSNDEVLSKEFYCAGCHKTHILDDNGYLNHETDATDHLRSFEVDIYKTYGGKT